MNFFDVIVKAEGEKFATDLLYKTADYYQYVHYSSHDQEHMKKSNVYCRRLRLKSLCFDVKGLNLHLKKPTKKRLLVNSWDYFAVGRERTFRRLLKKGPFIFSYLPHLKQLKKVIKNRLNLLYVHSEVKAVITLALRESFGTPREKNPFSLI